MDATGGQYEGFNYFGFGALVLMAIAVPLGFRQSGRQVAANWQFCAALFLLAAFAVSHRVYLGGWKLLDLDGSDVVNVLAGVFRSSGRMFWPVFYTAMLFGLVVVLRRVGSGWKSLLVLGCCGLQLVDTEPLRNRLALLARRDVPRLLDEAEWQARMRAAVAVQVVPHVLCSPVVLDATIANMELQYAAMAAERPIDSVYNPRLWVDCAAETARAQAGPWRSDTLYVFLAGAPYSVPQGWLPNALHCEPFSHGSWCLGAKATD